MALPNNRWDCPTCTYLNWTSSLKCSLCGCPRPVEVPPKAVIAKIKSHTQNSLCISKTSSSLEKTVPSPGGESPSPVSDRWICTVCTFKNLPNTTACTMCRSPRVSLSANDSSSYKSPSIFDFISTNSSGGAVGGVSVIDPLDLNVKKYSKQRHPSENKSGKRWKCSNCSYENYLRANRCTLCGVNRAFPGMGVSGISSTREEPAANGSYRRKVSSSKEDLRQIRNRLSSIDWLFLHACEGTVKGDASPVKEYLRRGGERLRQLTSCDVLVLGHSSKFTTGSSLIDLALRFHQSDILTLLLTPAPLEAHKRLPSQSNPDLADTVRSEVSLSLRQHEGNFPCFHFTKITTFVLPKEVRLFCDQTFKNILEEVVDLDVLRVLQEDNPVINWNKELVDELHSKLYPLWNRTAGDCLLDSTLQATWGVSDRQSTLRRALANSLMDCSSQFFSKWRHAEVSTAGAQGFSLDEDQLRTDWSSIVSFADRKRHSLDQAHIFVLAHILRRPILVYGVRIVENYRGEKLGPVNFEGVYLPLLWDSSFCFTSPISLAYTRGHFSALVSIASSKNSEDSMLSCDDHVTYLPLVDHEDKSLPVHFLSEHQLGCEEQLVKEYCDCHVTKKGVKTARQTVESEHIPQHLTELLDNWLDRFYQFDKKCLTFVD